MKIYESIANIMQESVAIGKNKVNQQQGFKYRGIDDVMNTFYPLLTQHKVFIVPEVLEQTREERTTKSGGNLIYSILKIKYTFFADDGSSVSATVIGEGMDSADKSSNKAMAVAMKYAMFQVFCIPTEEMPDPDANTPPQSTPIKKPTAKPAAAPSESLVIFKDFMTNSQIEAEIKGAIQELWGEMYPDVSVKNANIDQLEKFFRRVNLDILGVDEFSNIC